jgi:uroporphyrin-3 C-methyltransferase
MKPEHLEPSPHTSTDAAAPAPESAVPPAAQATETPASPESTWTPPSSVEATDVHQPVTSPWLLRSVGVLAVVGAVGVGLMWVKLSNIQEQLARQSADTGSQAVEARVTSKQAEELARETAARLAVTDAKLSEVSLQRSQLEELMQSLSRSRDENLVVDIESAIRLAQQQSQLTGSVQPLLAALNSAQQRLTKVAQPRLAPVLRALTRDIERVKSTPVADTPALLYRLDELVVSVDTLPLLNSVGPAGKDKPAAQPQPKSWARAISMSWWEQVLGDIWDDVKGLVRVSRVDRAEVTMLSPEQSYFVRENMKLRLLNVRLALLARHFDAVNSDMTKINEDLVRYFDTQSRQGQSTLSQARDVLAQTKQFEMPRIDDTLAALTTAAAGR